MSKKQIIEFIEKIAIPFPSEDLTDKELDDFFKEHGEDSDKYYLIPIKKLNEVKDEKERPIIRAKEALSRLRSRS